MRHLSSTPQRDYIDQDMTYHEQIRRASKIIGEADAVLIGGGAGLSTAAGLNFGGARFRDNFKDFIDKYDSRYMTDMYMAGFYPFKSQEEYWAYWSRHVAMNRVNIEALPLYKELYDLVGDKEHFIVTTNADAQFEKAGFKKEDIFATQGDYGLIQCAQPCHHKTYDAGESFNRMKDNIKDCRIPTDMVPRCPECGGPMAMNLRNDSTFVEDEDWHRAEEAYTDFLENIGDKRIALLELGIGFNTPIIIRFPFEKMVKANPNISLVRLNLNDAKVPESFGDRAIGIDRDIKKSLDDIYRSLKERDV